MKRQQKVISGIIFILAGLALLFWVIAPRVAPQTENVNIEPQIDVNQTISVDLEIGDVIFNLEVLPGTTAFEMMEQTKEEHALGFEFSESDFGIYITSINGVESSTETNEYWSYYINDELGEIGISSYILQDGDLITWRYEKIEF